LHITYKRNTKVLPFFDTTKFFRQKISELQKKLQLAEIYSVFPGKLWFNHKLSQRWCRDDTTLLIF
ncbi:MAG: hypothetical protein IJ160_10190, partial [Muribaculaceae bacterium]|nr:hypothetical protein [Muribaculaceae bacterium]